MGSQTHAGLISGGILFTSYFLAFASTSSSTGGPEQAKCQPGWEGTKVAMYPPTLAGPQATFLDNFLSPAEADFLRGKAELLVRKDFSRTSFRSQSTYKFVPSDVDERVRCIERRISAVTGIPLSHGEDINVAHYAKGENYGPHVDWGDQRWDTVRMPVRRTTVLLYLSDVEAGGGTMFTGSQRPNLNTFAKECRQVGNLNVAPKKGSAIMFHTHTPPGADRLRGMLFNFSSYHGGCPVIQGNKWVAQKWLWDRPLFLYRSTTLLSHAGFHSTGHQGLSVVDLIPDTQPSHKHMIMNGSARAVDGVVAGSTAARLQGAAALKMEEVPGATLIDKGADQDITGVTAAMWVQFSGARESAGSANPPRNLRIVMAVDLGLRTLVVGINRARRLVVMVHGVEETTSRYVAKQSLEEDTAWNHVALTFKSRRGRPSAYVMLYCQAATKRHTTPVIKFHLPGETTAQENITVWVGGYSGRTALGERDDGEGMELTVQDIQVHAEAFGEAQLTILKAGVHAYGVDPEVSMRYTPCIGNWHCTNDGYEASIFGGQSLDEKKKRKNIGKPEL
ncbi:hypothetical protein CYMTET_41098 [Cymbomonas tetramitiformis]|uniref:Fe2OG dioxygenase domain-containing protein n=1 Tax=Cymbomonas tetramitiformis TaxID=36881 RepID=A0AAE0F2W0_9CHLO|nr:hypothetical protein CYMTET_41098 [Cymbomonas tetramitiformis]